MWELSVETPPIQEEASHNEPPSACAPSIWNTSEWQRPLSPSSSIRLRPRQNYVQLTSNQLSVERDATLSPSPRSLFLTSVDMGPLPQRPSTTPAGSSRTHGPNQPPSPSAQDVFFSAPSTPSGAGSSHAAAAASAAATGGTAGGPPRQYTVQYMGIAKGELGILSKRELIVPRPSTAPEPSQRAHRPAPGGPTDVPQPLPHDAVNISALADNALGTSREPTNLFGAFYALRREGHRPAPAGRRNEPRGQENLARRVQDQKVAAARAVRTAGLRRDAAPPPPAAPLAPPCSKDFPITSRPRHLSAGGFAGWKMLPGPKLTAGGFPGQKLSQFQPDLIQRPVLPRRAQTAPQSVGARAEARRGVASPRAIGGRGAAAGEPAAPARSPGQPGMSTISEDQQQQGRQQRRQPGQSEGAASRPARSPRASPLPPPPQPPQQQQRPLTATLMQLALPEPPPAEQREPEAVAGSGEQQHGAPQAEASAGGGTRSRVPGSPSQRGAVGRQGAGAKGEWVLQGSPAVARDGQKQARGHSGRSDVGPWQTRHRDSDGDGGLTGGLGGEAAEQGGGTGAEPAL